MKFQTRTSKFQKSFKRQASTLSWMALLPKAGAGSNPVGGGLFIVPAPLARLPNPGGVICSAVRSQAAGWKAGQATPPGFQIRQDKAGRPSARKDVGNDKP